MARRVNLCEFFDADALKKIGVMHSSVDHQHH